MALCLFAAPWAALADTVTETFTFPEFANCGSEPGTGLSLFNPALGTLNSATFDLNATATWSGGGFSDTNIATIAMDVGMIAAGTFEIRAAGNVSKTGSRP